MGKLVIHVPENSVRKKYISISLAAVMMTAANKQNVHFMEAQPNRL